MKPISKIDTLFHRDGKFVVTEEIKRPVLGTISRWVVTEKVDGTSMRVGWFRENERNNAPPEKYWVRFDEGSRRIGFFESGPLIGFVAGKSDSAEIPGPLRTYCENIVHRNALTAINRMEQYGLQSLTLYGEGYGGKIQKGTGYRPDQAFILFDVRAEDGYLSDELVTQYGLDFGVNRVPLLGEMSLPEMVNLARNGFESRVAALFGTAGHQAEGLVGRPLEPLYDARGERLIVKLKTRDWGAHHGGY